MLMDQITKRSFGSYNNRSYSIDCWGHCCNRIYFYTNCNYLFDEEENPNTMIVHWSCQVILQSMRDHCGGKALSKNDCQQMDMFVFRQLNILLEHL
jgi:hypothetical protein